MSNTSTMFSKEQKELITRSIKEAELNTSGEIRVHIESKCNEDVMDRASYWFARLKMHKTQLRNGVLFYLAIKDRKFAILGDKGINAAVPENFWNEAKETMLPYFAESNFAEGLSKGILMAGDKLKEFFTYQKDDVNELNDEISFGK
jgi:uncharacterized membrane protein